MRYKAVVFDVDGTLIDTRSFVEVLAEAHRRLYPQLPRRPIGDYRRCYPMTGPMMWAYLGIPDEDVPQLHVHIHDIISQWPGEYGPLFDGVRQAVTELHQMGLVLGVNTSRKQDYFAQARQRFGAAFWDCFSICIGEDMVAHPKPAPDSLELFCQLAQLPAPQVLFVGDSESDSRCAAAAGCPFACAGWGLFAGQPPPPHQHLLQAPEELPALLAGH